MQGFPHRESEEGSLGRGDKKWSKILEAGQN
jgi:hypothetical protein